jgi:hypothetical protein
MDDAANNAQNLTPELAGRSPSATTPRKGARRTGTSPGRRAPLDSDEREALRREVQTREAEQLADVPDDVPDVAAPPVRVALPPPPPLPAEDCERHLTSIFKLGGVVYALAQLQRGSLENLDEIASDAAEMACDVAPEISAFSASRHLRPIGAIARMLNGPLRFVFRRASRAATKQQGAAK